VYAKISNIAEVILPHTLGLQRHIRKRELSRLPGDYSNPDYEGKATPLLAWRVPKASRRLRI
jgi:hypothetical protein